MDMSTPNLVRYHPVSEEQINRQGLTIPQRSIPICLKASCGTLARFIEGTTEISDLIDNTSVSNVELKIRSVA
jgi:hypothetical protein